MDSMLPRRFSSVRRAAASFRARASAASRARRSRSTCSAARPEPRSVDPGGRRSRARSAGARIRQVGCWTHLQPAAAATCCRRQSAAQATLAAPRGSCCPRYPGGQYERESATGVLAAMQRRGAAVAGARTRPARPPPLPWRRHERTAGENRAVSGLREGNHAAPRRSNAPGGVAPKQHLPPCGQVPRLVLAQGGERVVGEDARPVATVLPASRGAGQSKRVALGRPFTRRRRLPHLTALRRRTSSSERGSCRLAPLAWRPVRVEAREEGGAARLAPSSPSSSARSSSSSSRSTRSRQCRSCSAADGPASRAAG